MRDPAVVAARRARMGEPHVAALAAHAAAIRARRGGVPDFDPAEAGVRAQVLILLEAPTAGAAGGSGFVSADNDDESAANLWHAHRAAGTDRANEVATWTVVPWHHGDRPPARADIRAGAGHLAELAGLLPGLRVVVLLGAVARRGWAQVPVEVPVIAAHREELHMALAVAREQAGLA